MTHRVAVVIPVEEVGHSDDQLVVAVAVDVADGWVAQDVGIDEHEALLALVRLLPEVLVLPEIILTQRLHMQKARVSRVCDTSLAYLQARVNSLQAWRHPEAFFSSDSASAEQVRMHSTLFRVPQLMLSGSDGSGLPSC